MEIDLAQVLDGLKALFVMACVSLLPLAGICVIAAVMLSGRISREEEAADLRRRRVLDEQRTKFRAQFHVVPGDRAAAG